MNNILDYLITEWTLSELEAITTLWGGALFLILAGAATYWRWFITPLSRKIAGRNERTR